MQQHNTTSSTSTRHHFRTSFPVAGSTALPRPSAHADISTLRSLRASLLLLCGLWLAAAPLAAQPGSLDPGFDPGTGANNTVQAMALLPNGKILIGGHFTTYNGTPRNRIARLHADGSPDTGFNPGTGADGTVQAMALQPDGKILIVGNFLNYNGTSRNSIARLHANGSLDTGFSPGTGADGPVFAMALQPDGKIIIGGTFTGYNGTPRFSIARLNANGSLDTDFDPGSGANNSVRAMALNSDGKILIGGDFTSYDGTPRSRISQINANGSLDTGFDPGTGASSGVKAIALQPNGKIIIGGFFSTYNDMPRRYITRLNTDGSLDTDFETGMRANDYVLTMALQPDGKILIGGTITNYDGTSRNRIARLNADATLDTGFDPGMGANNLIQTLAQQPDGKILIGGNFTNYYGTPRNRIARVNGDAFVLPGDVCATSNDIQALFGQAINTVQVSTPYDNTGANNAGDPGINISTCFFADPVQYSLWYTFTGDGDAYRIRTVQGTSTNYMTDGDTQAALFTGDCANPVFVACNDDENAAANKYNIRIEVNTVAGQTYRLLLDGYEGLQGQFCLEVTRLGNVDATEITDTPVRLTPNPTTGIIQLSNIRAEEVQVFDCTGRLVQRLLRPGNTVDLSAQVAGLYLLQIREKGEVYSARVVKE
jgi:uncharacterized delta-60 repeat protein